MLTQHWAIYERLGHALNAVAERPGFSCFNCVPLLDGLFSVPVVSVALDQQIKRGKIKVKHESLSGGKFGMDFDAFALNAFAHSSLYGCLSHELAITRERTELRSALFDAIRCASECLTASLARQDNRWASASLGAVMPPSAVGCAISERGATSLAISINASRIAARLRAVVIPCCVGSRHAKIFLAVRTSLSYAVSTASHGTINTRLAAALIERKGSFAFTARERSVFAALLPHITCSARTAATTARRALCGYKLFAAIRASVNVLFSQGVNLIDRLAFRSGPLACFEHSSGSPILTQVSL